MSVQPQLFDEISQLLELARKRVVTSVNQTMVITYFKIGRMIVEDEQNGENRFEYGKAILKDLSLHLTERFGKGFSETNLKQMRQFYLSYSISQTASVKSLIQIRQTVSDELQKKDNQEFEAPETYYRKSFPQFHLSWSHYLKLMRINNIEERKFYEIEAYKNNWNLRELQRQY